MKFTVDSNANTTKYFARILKKYAEARHMRESLVNGDIKEYVEARDMTDMYMAACYDTFKGAVVEFADGKTYIIENMADVMNIGIKAFGE